MSPRRATSGGLVDRSRSIRFSFDGHDYTGHPGDTRRPRREQRQQALERDAAPRGLGPDARERPDDRAAGGDPPDAVRDLPVHDLRAVKQAHFTFVMLNLFQHPWSTLPFDAALRARSGHGP